jgi:hypothetical protein
LRALGFSEESAMSAEKTAAIRVDLECDSEEFECKVSTLIKRAYDLDKQKGKLQDWDDALDALAGHDVYVLVMVDRAGIRGSSISSILDWRLAVVMIPAALCVGAAAFVAFSRLGGELIPNDFARLFVVILLLLAPLFLGKLGRRRVIQSS